MVEIAPIAEIFGGLFLIAAFFALVFAVCASYVSDETLYDRTLLPSSDPRKLSYFVEPSESPQPFPTVFDEASLYVSFVIPAYNEEKRLPKMLDETIEYLKKRQAENSEFTYEIIIVDDGSKDNTAKLALNYASTYPEVRLLRQPVNMGKGAAIQAGCLHSRGKMILMVDADGATKIDEFGELEKRLLQSSNPECIVVGSRAHIEEASKAERTFVRKILGLGFHSLVLMSGVRGVKDTQCGFKLFSREAAKWLFPNQHIQRWCFDPELLVIGRARKMNIIEVPVEWHEIEGSKMKVSAMVKMAIDLIQIGVFHMTGIWSVKDRYVPPTNM